MATLYICGTPIGNLEDVSIRLLKTLRRVDIIACEDTRQSMKLLKRYRIKTRMVSYHEHSRPEKEDYLVGMLLDGHDVALMSDAGMPGISDPGAGLIRKAREAGIKLESVPGPTALATAFSLTGLPDTAFIFAGFLERKKTLREDRIRELASQGMPVILYESPHRLLACLESLAAVYGMGHEIMAARELTKMYEETRQASLETLIEHFKVQPPRGEFCLVIPAMTTQPSNKSLEQIADEVLDMVDKGFSKKEALKLKAREYRIARSELYRYMIDVE